MVEGKLEEKKIKGRGRKKQKEIRRKKGNGAWRETDEEN